MANHRNRQRNYRNDDFRQQQNQDENHYDATSWLGQTGGQWGEDINDMPYNASGGYINTQTNYDQGNYDYSRPGDEDFDPGNRYGQDRVANERNYGGNRRQQSSYPSDAYSGRHLGDQGADQAYGTSPVNRRNAAYDEGQYRSTRNRNDRNQSQQSNYGRPDYGGRGADSRNEQPGFDHGRQHQSNRGYYESQNGQPNLNNQTSYGNTQDSHRGKGPKAYKRTDERITENINDRLTDDPHIDASDIEVSVQNGEVILSGYVASRFAKRHAEDITEAVAGVKNLENRLRVGSAASGMHEDTQSRQESQNRNASGSGGSAPVSGASRRKGKNSA